MTLPADLEALRRRASVARVGGFRPPEDPATSWMGTVKLCRSGERWPECDGAPMHGLLQLATRELPFCPPVLADVALLALFVADELPGEAGWDLRTYESLEGLQPLPRPEWTGDPRLPKDHDPALKPFPLAFSEVEDWPGVDNLPFELIDLWQEHFEDEREPHTGLKVGGWP